jgi:hypothetical protein
VLAVADAMSVLEPFLSDPFRFDPVSVLERPLGQRVEHADAPPVVSDGCRDSEALACPLHCRLAVPRVPFDFAEQPDGDCLPALVTQPPIDVEALVREVTRLLEVLPENGGHHHPALHMRYPELISERSVFGHALVVDLRPALELADDEDNSAVLEQRPSMKGGVDIATRGEETLEPAARLERRAGNPELLERQQQLQANLRDLLADRGAERLSKIRELRGRELLTGDALAVLPEVRRLGYLEVVLGVSAVERARDRKLLQLLRGELTDRLEQDETAPADRLDEAHLDECVDLLERRADHGLDRVERE